MPGNIATKTDDQKLREKTAKEWSEMNNTTILPEQINCEGCRIWRPVRHLEPSLQIVRKPWTI